MGVKESPRTDTIYYENLRYKISHERILKLIYCGLQLVLKEHPWIGENDPFIEQDGKLIIRELDRLSNIQKGRDKYKAIQARKLAQFLESIGKCTHDDRRKQAHGLCQTCYHRWWRRVKQHEDSTYNSGSSRIDSADNRDNAEECSQLEQTSTGSSV